MAKQILNPTKVNTRPLYEIDAKEYDSIIKGTSELSDKLRRGEPLDLKMKGQPCGFTTIQGSLYCATFGMIYVGITETSEGVFRIDSNKDELLSAFMPAIMETKCLHALAFVNVSFKNAPTRLLLPTSAIQEGMFAIIFNCNNIEYALTALPTPQGGFEPAFMELETLMTLVSGAVPQAE